MSPGNSKMGEKFNLTWNDFQSNITRSFKSLREETSLFDVTLISRDHKSVAAHRVVLSACSEFFKTIFHKNVSTNMSLYLDCATSKEISLVLDIAEKLKLDGFLSNGEKTEDSFHHGTKEENPHDTKRKNINQQQSDKNCSSVASKSDESVLATLNQSVQCSNDQVEEKFQELILKEDKLFRCTVFNKTMPHRSNMKKHLETHLSGLSYLCPLCGKSFRSENAFLHHKRFRCANKV